MASQVDNGPATNNAVLTFNTNAPGVEVHVALGVDPLDPNHSPFVDPSAAYTGTVVNKMTAGVNFAIPS